jgi:hypothetical protein
MLLDTTILYIVAIYMLVLAVAVVRAISHKERVIIVNRVVG